MRVARRSPASAPPDPTGPALRECGLMATGLRRRLPPALHERDFALFILVVLAMNFASQMIAVAIGWQVYDVHHRAFDLGLIGLLEFAPVFLLSLPAGHLA